MERHVNCISLLKGSGQNLRGCYTFYNAIHNSNISISCRHRSLLLLLVIMFSKCVTQSSNTSQAANVTEALGSAKYALDLATIGSGFSLSCVSEPENWEMLLTNEAVQ